jgi:hypothetical protein
MTRRRFRDAERIAPEVCRRCRGSGIEPGLTDNLPPAMASRMVEVGRQIARDPVSRALASELLARVAGATPPDGVVADDEATMHREAEQ